MYDGEEEGKKTQTLDGLDWAPRKAIKPKVITRLEIYGRFHYDKS